MMSQNLHVLDALLSKEGIESVNTKFFLANARDISVDDVLREADKAIQVARSATVSIFPQSKEDALDIAIFHEEA
jgi:hypothetical protein